MKIIFIDKCVFCLNVARADMLLAIKCHDQVKLYSVLTALTAHCTHCFTVYQTLSVLFTHLSFLHLVLPCGISFLLPELFLK